MPRLVLARDEGQEVEIGRHIRIKVVNAQGGKARLLITAPASVPVLRRELAPEVKASLIGRCGHGQHD